MHSSLLPFDELEAAVDRVNAEDRSGQSRVLTRSGAVQFERIKAKLAGLEAKLAREFELDRDWTVVGALTPAQFLAGELKIPSAAFRRQFSVGRRLAELPAVVEALIDAEITPTHRDKILAVDNRRVHAQLVADQEMLVRWAMTMTWGDFCLELAEWLLLHDPDGNEPTAARNSADWSITLDDRWVIDADLDPFGGAIVAAELDRLERLEFEADWAEARERLGAEPLEQDLRRTPRQRRAAALIEMARRSADAEGRGKVVLSIFGGEQGFKTMMKTSAGNLVTPGEVADRIDEDTWFETFFVGAGMRDISKSAMRNYVGALRRAILGIKGVTCSEPYCDKPADQTDHWIPVSRGGETTFEHGNPMCATHNRRKGATDPRDDDAP